MASGLSANVTLASLNQDYGADLANLRNALNRLKTRYDTYWSAVGPTQYVALGGSTGDRDTLGSAITEAVALYNVYYGLATIASGTVTVGAGGHNFDTLIKSVVGDGGI